MKSNEIKQKRKRKKKQTKQNKHTKTKMVQQNEFKDYRTMDKHYFFTFSFYGQNVHTTCQ